MQEAWKEAWKAARSWAARCAGSRLRSTCASHFGAGASSRTAERRSHRRAGPACRVFVTAWREGAQRRAVRQSEPLVWGSVREAIRLGCPPACFSALHFIAQYVLRCSFIPLTTLGLRKQSLLPACQVRSASVVDHICTSADGARRSGTNQESGCQILV